MNGRRVLSSIVMHPSRFSAAFVDDGREDSRRAQRHLEPEGPLRSN